MRFIVCQAFVALVLLWSRHGVAAPYPTEQQLRTAIGAAEAVMAAEGLSAKVFDARDAGITLPLMAAGLDVEENVCLVFYNPTPEKALKKFFEAVEEKDLPVWLGAIAVHEATHCIEQREAYIRHRFDKVLPPNLMRDGMTVQGYLGVVKSGAVETWSEALADIASVLYLKQASPEHWQGFARGIMAMRRELAGRWPDHDTSPWLRKLIAARDAVPPPQSCFEAAFRLRREFSPR